MFLMEEKIILFSWRPPHDLVGGKQGRRKSRKDQFALTYNQPMSIAPFMYLIRM
jgi:hypothetical protein